jgi:ribosomal-protein-alanine N-acetyltransferase
MNTPVIQTERLVLRGFTEADIPELVPLIGIREVAQNTLRIPHPYEERHAREFFGMAPKPNELRLAITRRSNNQLCGGIGLHPDNDHRRAELGYWLGVPFWGNGYAAEAARSVVEYGFTHFGLNRIFASHFQGNPASGNVLRKIGMKHEGCLRQHLLKWDRFIDLEMYAILREDWAGIK